MRSRQALTRVVALVVALAAFVASVSAPLEREARADPQTTVGVTVGGAVADVRASDGPRAAFHLGLHADLLLLRTRERDMAIGPYVEALSERFATLETGGGASWLLPVVSSMPLVVSAGAFARHTSAYDWEPGVAGRLLFGPRGYNYHSVYSLTNGLFVQTRWGLGDGKQGDVVIGAQIDLLVLALPWIYLYEAIAH